MDVEPIEIVRWRLAPEKGREEDEAGFADRCTQVASPRVSLSLPNGSRLSCGRLARRRKGVGRQSVPARAQYSASLRAITARQLQALVRRLPNRALPTPCAHRSSTDRRILEANRRTSRACLQSSPLPEAPHRPRGPGERRPSRCVVRLPQNRDLTSL